MNRQFVRPLLLLVLAILLVMGIAPHIPTWDNSIVPLKKFEWQDMVTPAQPEVKAAEIQATVEKLAVNSQLTPLDSFVDKLKTAAGANIRIGYFGDSIIEADLISGTLRPQL